MKRFIIAGMQRSGTTLIHKLLMEHSEISSLSAEVPVRPFFEKGVECLTMGNWISAKEKELSFQAIFDSICMVNEKTHTKAVGLKTTIKSKDDVELLIQNSSAWLSNIFFIIIIRKNILDQYCSLLRAKKTNIWHSHQKENEKINVKIRINKPALYLYLLEAQAVQKKLLEQMAKKNVKVIFYEDIVKSGVSNIATEVFEFLDVSKLSSCNVPLKKLNNNPADYIANYISVKKYYAKFLNKEITSPPFDISIPFLFYSFFQMAGSFFYRLASFIRPKNLVV